MRRSALTALAQENAELRAKVSELRSEQAQADRRDALLSQANADRDVWAAKVQAMEERMDGLVAEQVDRAVKLIEARLETTAAKH